VLWDQNGIPKALVPLDGFTWSSASAINNRGQVVGKSYGGSPTMAVIWSRKGKAKVLPPLPGDVQRRASAINNRGEVAGTSQSATGTSTAVIWDSTRTPRPLPSVNGSTVDIAFGIDPTHEAVGLSNGAVLWDRSGTPIPLSPLDGYDTSIAFAINNRGEIAGSNNRSDDDIQFSFTTTAVVWR
jgi:uncharacterized membrane protein